MHKLFLGERKRGRNSSGVTKGFQRGEGNGQSENLVVVSSKIQDGILNLANKRRMIAVDPHRKTQICSGVGRGLCFFVLHRQLDGRRFLPSLLLRRKRDFQSLDAGTATRKNLPKNCLEATGHLYGVYDIIHAVIVCTQTKDERIRR